MPTFRCPSCSRAFPWRENLAGKKVKCPCGNVFVAPDLTADDAVDVAPDPPPAPIAKAVINTANDSRLLDYERRKVANPANAALDRSSQLRDIWLPVGLCVAGIGVRVAQVFLPSMATQPVFVTLGLIVGGLVLNVILMLVGVMAAAHIFGTDLGSFSSVVTKLTSAAVLGGAIASYAAAMDWGQGVTGLVIALHALVLIYFILFSIFFEMDLLETLFTVVIVMLLQIAALCVAVGRMRF